MGRPFEQPSPEVCSQPPYVLICTVGIAPTCYWARVALPSLVKVEGWQCLCCGADTLLPREPRGLRNSLAEKLGRLQKRPRGSRPPAKTRKSHSLGKCRGTRFPRSQRRLISIHAPVWGATKQSVLFRTTRPFQFTRPQGAFRVCQLQTEHKRFNSSPISPEKREEGIVYMAAGLVAASGSNLPRSVVKMD